MDYATSAYNTEKVRLTLWIPLSCKERYEKVRRMFGATKSDLFCRWVDEMFYEPLEAPTLPRTLHSSTQRLIHFFRHSDPPWRAVPK